MDVITALLCYSNIKLSSPKINNVIIAGSILLYVCVFISAADYGQIISDSSEERICMVSGFMSILNSLGN